LHSVTTVDYEYTKAYGGIGNKTVSSAGGTFGSNTHGIAEMTEAAASAGAAPDESFSDTESLDTRYRAFNPSVKEILVDVFAPPGKLGVVIDTPDDGAPVIHAIKDSSVIVDQIQVGDKLVAVDDQDVRSMSAIKVSKLISRASENPSRKLTVLRTIVE
jgi:C-terminal processing protease CtpA/Prc